MKLAAKVALACFVLFKATIASELEELFATDGVSGEKLGRSVAASTFDGRTCAAAGAPTAKPNVCQACCIFVRLAEKLWLRRGESSLGVGIRRAASGSFSLNFLPLGW